MINLMIFWNVVTFLLYGIDKRRAKQGKWRISEKTLIISSLLFGGIGAFLGMYFFRHKTKHTLFLFAVPLSAVITFALILYILH